MTPTFRGALAGVVALAGALACAGPAAAVTVGQVDTFEDGTTQGWTVAFGPGGGVHPAPPANVAAGGPQGADDNYLLLTALGGPQPGGRLTAGNLTQWTGDYQAAGVGRIGMWVNNLGAGDLSLRLLFEDPAGGPPTNVAFSADPIVVAAGSGWRRIVFSLAEADLIAGVGTVGGALADTTVLRLYHAVADGFPGEAQAGLLGVDDIEAVAGIPEPTTWALMIAGFGAVGALARRKRGRAGCPALG